LDQAWHETEILMAFDPQALLAARPDLQRNWDNATSQAFRDANPDDPNVNEIASYGSLDRYLKATWYALGQPDASSLTPAPASTGGSGNDTSTGQFGGASNEGGVVTGGAVTAPIASGEDSTAVQTGQGGNAIGGSVDAPVISAPISNSPTSFGDDSPVVGSAGVGGGRDVAVTAPIVSGNSGPVTVETADPTVAAAAIDANNQVAKAAIDASQQALSSSLSSADKALNSVTNSQKPADERVTNSALTAVTVIVVALGALALFNRRKAA
jgi:hypothetical protein